MAKNKRGGRRDRLRHTASLSAHPLGDGFLILGWACDDPACLDGTELEGIHHSHPSRSGDSPENENDPRLTTEGRSATHPKYQFGGAFGAHGTPT